MRFWPDTVLRVVPIVLVAAALPAPAASAATSPATSLSGRTFQCWQAPDRGATDRVNRGQVAFATDYVPRYLRAGRQGAFTATPTGVRFTSGPLRRPTRRVGDVHPRGVAMPGDRRRAARYQLVLRAARDTGAAAWYCQDVS